MKKIISIVLLCTMLLACFAGCGAKKGQIALNNDVEMQNLAVTIPADWKTGLEAWDGTSVTANWATQETLTIANGADLKAFVDALKAGNDFSGKTITVTEDINLGNQEWNPTVQASGQTFFKGTFDGDDHIIGNFVMTIDASDTDVTAHALLCSVGQGATVQDLKVVEGTITYTNTAADTTVAGGIIAEANTSGADTAAARITLSNLYSAVTITNSDSTKKIGTVGGIVGKAKGGGYIVIENCISNSPITVKGAAVGGILGIINADVKGVTIRGCEVLAAVSGASQVGGIIGDMATTSNDGAYHATLIDCLVKANLSATGNNIGGMIGKSNNSKRTINVTNCDIPAASNVVITGGGNQNGGVIGITCNAAVEVNISDCDINATLTFSNTGGQNGGIIGSANSTTINVRNCTYNGTMTSDRSSGGIIGIVNKSSSSTRVMINGCTVNGTLNYDLAGNNNLYMGGIVGLARVGSGAMYVLNCTVDATMNMTFNHNSAAATEYTGAGGLIGGANDPDVDTSTGVFIIKNNKVLGQMNVTDNDVDGAAENYVDAIAEKAGVLVGSSTNAAGNSFQYGNNQITDGTKTLAVTATGIEVDMVGTDIADYIDIIGYQTTEVVDGTYDLRVVATARADIDALGFIANIKYTDAEGNVIGDRIVTEYVKNVYSSINGGDEVYTADAYRTDYFFTLEIKGIPEAYNEERLGIQLHAIGAKVTPGEGDAYTIDKYLRGAVVTYGTFATKESENNVVISDSAEQALPTTLAAVIGKETADITVDMDSYTDSYYTGVRIQKEAYYPDTNTPHYNDASSMEANIYTYTIDIPADGAYDIVFELRCKDNSSRGVYMFINGEDGYFIKNASLVNAGSYAADNDENLSVNSRYAVALSGYEFKAGENKLTFKLDRTLAGAMHVRGIYINATPAVED